MIFIVTKTISSTFFEETFPDFSLMDTCSKKKTQQPIDIFRVCPTIIIRAWFSYCKDKIGVKWDNVNLENSNLPIIGYF